MTFFYYFPTATELFTIETNMNFTMDNSGDVHALCTDAQASYCEPCEVRGWSNHTNEVSAALHSRRSQAEILYNKGSQTF